MLSYKTFWDTQYFLYLFAVLVDVVSDFGHSTNKTSAHDQSQLSLKILCEVALHCQKVTTNCGLVECKVTHRQARSFAETFKRVSFS